MNDNHNQATDGEAKAKPEVIKLGLGVLYPDSLVDQTRLAAFHSGNCVLNFFKAAGRHQPTGARIPWVRASARERTSFTRPLAARLPDKILHA